MQACAHALGNGRKKQIGPDGCARWNVEEQHEDRRHERTSADTGRADKTPNNEASDCEAQVHVPREPRAILL